MSPHMKLFSSARLKPFEVLGAFINIQTYKHPILPPDMYHFVPILVTKFVQPYTFEPHFMGSNSPILDIYMMREFRFPYVYTMRDYGVDPPKPKVYTSYSFKYDIYIVDDIQIPGELKVGDVILSVSGK